MRSKMYEIGSFRFTVTYPEELAIPRCFSLFERTQVQGAEVTSESKEPFQYRIEILDQLPEPEGKLVTRREDLLVYNRFGREERRIGVRGQTDFYAFYQETSDREALICVNRADLPLFAADPAFVSLFALEKQLLCRREMVLHCAYVEHAGEAILFSAPSGVGKSTQANLWEQYRDAHTINGDRALLSKASGRWNAMGWPVCGSSEICENRSMGIRAIVLLSQAAANSARRLTAGEAFLQLYAQLTVNGWDRNQVKLAGDLLEQLVTEVPVFHLACTMEEQAVDVLENVLADMPK